MMTGTDTPERLTYTVKEVAQALGISKEAVWDRVWDGTIPSVRVGRRVLVPRRALERFVDPAETATSANG